MTRRLVTVVSRNRPYNVEKMYGLGLPEDTVWVVSGDAPVDEYAVRGAKSTMHMDTKFVTQKRKAIVDYAWVNGYDEVVMVDDDLRKCKRVDGAGDKHDITIAEAIGIISGRLVELGLFYGGIGPTDNAYFVKQAFHTDKFVRSNLIVIRNDPRHLNFDTEFVCKADYDLTCQHLDAYGGAVRCDELLLSFPYKTNAGGCQDYRTLATHMEAIARLEHKWPGVFRRNTRREGEVLLKWQR